MQLFSESRKGLYSVRYWMGKAAEGSMEFLLERTEWMDKEPEEVVRFRIGRVGFFAASSSVSQRTRSPPRILLPGASMTD
jgi:hypothetical protein